jgi:uncharacterized protein (DUF924 family)
MVTRPGARFRRTAREYHTDPDISWKFRRQILKKDREVFKGQQERAILVLVFHESDLLTVIPESCYISE